MPRSGYFRLLAAVLFVIGGLAEPAWELAHALTHLHREHEAKAEVVPGATLLLATIGDDYGHRHPILDPAIRSTSEHAAAGSALPSSIVQPCRANAPVRIIPLVVIPEARAGPDPNFPSQSRAPPLL